MMFLQRSAQRKRNDSLETLEMDRKAAELANHEIKVTEGKTVLDCRGPELGCS
jgi:hypothetical protein